ncbi:MAG: S41 family peptidase [Lachnospiraceae bacterium]|nr:S41 family peptidase [Lachnospiraceae bacterium]
MRTVWSKRLIVGVMAGVMTISLVGCSGPLRMVTEKVEESKIENSSESKDEQSSSVKMLNNSDVIGKETNEKLERIEDLIDDNFYFEDDDEAKQDGIIRGYMDSLDDPYSVYYTAEEYADFMEDADGEYVGVGVQVSQDIETKVITVTKVFDGPAKEAGIQNEDVLTKVNGEDITTQDINAVVDKIKGEEGTEVTVTVYRASDKKEHDFTMKRRKVENPTVEYKMLDNNIGYIQISSFAEVTAEQFVEGIINLDTSGMEGLIIDLRDNGGGLLDIAVAMLDYMLPEGKIVYTEDKDGNVTSEYTSTDEYQFNKPLVVLVNGYSASASEIFAGAIKDYGIGTIIGETTYGKGIVQRMFPLDDGSAIKLTIAKYFTPKGNDIHKIGIEPDVEVELDADAYRESDGEKDNQLDAAIECIMQKLGKSTSTTEAAAENTTEE